MSSRGKSSSSRRRSKNKFGPWLWVAVLVSLVTVGLSVIALSPRATESTYVSQPVEPIPTIAPTPRSMVVFLGDSYTAGVGSSDGVGFASILSRAKGWTFQNLGRGGTGYLQGGQQEPESSQIACGLDYCPSYPEMISELVAANPTIVIVNGGRNNVLAVDDQLTAGIPSFFQQLREALPDAQIMATSPIWDDDAAPPMLTTIANLVQSSVEGVSGQYLDIGEPLSGHTDFVATDGVHPNNAGHKAIADAAMKALAATE